jgi:hypothetical protein
MQYITTPVLHPTYASSHLTPNSARIVSAEDPAGIVLAEENAGIVSARNSPLTLHATGIISASCSRPAKLLSQRSIAINSPTPCASIQTINDNTTFLSNLVAFSTDCLALHTPSLDNVNAVSLNAISVPSPDISPIIK